MAVTRQALRPFSSKTTAAGDGPFRELHDVELFAVGDHHDTGKPFTLDTIREIKTNFDLMANGSDVHHYPACMLGHDEDQAYLKAILRDDKAYQAFVDRMDGHDIFHKRTSQLCCGLPENLRIDEQAGKLLGDIKRIPPSIADMIDNGELRYPSAGFYDPMVYDGKTYGLAIHHVAFLGAQPPGVKRIKPFGKTTIPEATPELAFCERTDRFGRYRFLAFTEAPTMTKPELIAALKKKHPTFGEKWWAALDSLTVEVLQTMHDEAPVVVEPPTPPPPLVPAPTPPVSVAGDPPPTPAPPTAITPAQAKELSLAFADLRKTADELKLEQRRTAADEARRQKSERTAAVRAYCDLWVAEGRIIPAEADEQAGVSPDKIVPNTFWDGLRASSTQAYCDGGMSEFDAWVKRNQAKPEGSAGPILSRRAFADSRVVQPMQRTDMWTQIRERAKVVRGVDQPGKTLEQRLNMLPARSGV